MNITSFGKALQIKGSTIYRWYRDVLSDYAKDPSMIHKHDVQSQGNRDPIEVPIFKAENFGEKMAIDEKHIGEDICTVISNRESGKIALLTKSMNFSDLHAIFQQHNIAVEKVQTITRDFSSLFEKVCTTLFPNTTQIGDKFHVIKNLMEAHQSVRIRYRQKEFEKRRKALQEFKKSESERLIQCESMGLRFKPGKFNYKEEHASNGETMLEILARSRYLLYKYPNQWSIKQKTRARLLFQYFPEIQKAYNLCNQFRNFMVNDNIGKHLLELDKELNQWYEDVEDANIDEISNFKSLVESNEQIILNYFLEGETNALSESINSKIQHLLMANRGNRNKDFFFFRVGLFYA